MNYMCNLVMGAVSLIAPSCHPDVRRDLSRVLTDASLRQYDNGECRVGMWQVYI